MEWSSSSSFLYYYHTTHTQNLALTCFVTLPLLSGRNSNSNSNPTNKSFNQYRANPPSCFFPKSQILILNSPILNYLIREINGTWVVLAPVPCPMARPQRSLPARGDSLTRRRCSFSRQPVSRVWHCSPRIRRRRRSRRRPPRWLHMAKPCSRSPP